MIAGGTCETVVDLGSGLADLERISRNPSNTNNGEDRQCDRSALKELFGDDACG
jgi:hypothetical protein